MNKEKFVDYMKQLKEEFDRHEIINRGLEALCSESISVFYNNPLIDLVIDILSDEMDDMEWISYYIFECDWGERNEPFAYEGEEALWVGSFEQLYDFLEKENGKQDHSCS